ncbi:AhpC/TSA family protein [Mucilaginibacter yixingensis]|uniref:AhpC/TSA family protein n=1 Tax=Mucilaginibacter yixingensis TaxID=1295612 RepID=A0A2T5JFD8_9SPHI|nr:TlpA disulfide reductase family protein [Mucilaginibacter yixingensis]PTR01150.1 AhpC/TSA family protein [Mucilaginibacter yixingensis]
MKTILLGLNLLFFLGLQAQPKPSISLSGNIAGMAGKSIIVSGPAHFKKQVQINKSGDFNISFEAVTGYYNFNGNSIFLEPGDNLNISKPDSVYIYKGKGSAENNLLKSLDRLIFDYLPLSDNTPAKVYLLEPDSLYSKLNNYQAAADRLMENPELSKYFRETQHQRITYVNKFFEYNYLLNYGYDQEKRKEELALVNDKKLRENVAEWTSRIRLAHEATIIKRLSPDQRKELNTRIWEGFDVNNEELYKFCTEYNRLLDATISRFVQAESIKNPVFGTKNLFEKKRDIVNKEITNSYIKESLLYEYTVGLLKQGNDIDRYYNEYLALAKDPVYIKGITAIRDNMKLLAPGLASPSFKLPDTQGRLVGLEDFKGKYVYIDLWATWCGPCMAEVPFLKDVTKKYAGLNIAFISISIDKLSDAAKWKTTVKTHELSGTQLLAENEWKSDFVKKYNVNSIPRFILLDPDGKIISADADRPSAASLQVLLDKLLVKK